MGEGEEKKTQRDSQLQRTKTEGWWREVDSGWAKWVMGIKDSTSDEHWVPYVSDESPHSTTETNFTIYINQLEFKQKHEIKKKGYLFTFSKNKKIHNLFFKPLWI